MINYNSIGYGSLKIAKQFDGDQNSYDIWEDSFMAALRIMKLHIAFDNYSDNCTSDFNATKAKQTAFII